MNNELKKINFGQIIRIKENPEEYSYSKCNSNGGHEIEGFCTSCEEKGFHRGHDDQNFKLQNISHAAHSENFLQATNFQEDSIPWNYSPVMFLMEGPSKDYDIFLEKSFNGITKYPSRHWYWIHGDKSPLKYPEAFKGREYGTLFNSIIYTFRLRNAYLTNLVKCGLNGESNTFRGIGSYNWKCVWNCFQTILEKEIIALQPKIIFCFGSLVQQKITNFLGGGYPNLIVGLPHPASGRRGFKDDYFRHLYFSIINESLYQSSVITKEESLRNFDLFLSRK